MIFASAGSRSRSLTPRKVAVVLLSITVGFLAGGSPHSENARRASAQSISDEILDKMKHARRLLLGERPCGMSLTARGDAWRTLYKGLEGRILRVSLEGGDTSATLHIVRADPAAVAVRGLVSKAFGQESATVDEFANRSGALAVTNGGYFDTTFRPLGLVIVDGKRKKSLVRLRGRRSDVLYDGVFLMKNGRPSIQRNEDYRPDGEEVALQAGPLLIANGRDVSSLNGLNDAKRLDGRTILALDARGRILIWVTSSPLGGMNWCEIRDVLLQYSDGGSETDASESRIEWALNMDGGTSAQLFVERTFAPAHALGVKGSPVPVALGFFPQE